MPDVVVVGGGPAGSTLAGLLAARNVKVLLLDAARFPREKPCGECLNPGAVAALERLGSWEAVEPLRPWRLTGWKMASGNRQVTVPLPGVTGAVVERRRLDLALLQRAASRGAQVQEGVRVTDLLWEGGRVAGVVAACRGRRLRIPSALVVGADGLRSTVLRRLGLMGPGRLPPRLALTGHWTGVGDLSDWGELHFRGRAVCGIAPFGGGAANIVLVLPAEAVKGGVRSQAEVLHRWPGLRERLAEARPEGRSLATGPFHLPVRTLCAPGALLVGDAAGYLDPTTGQGLYRAFRSAELAAPAILSALDGGGLSAGAVGGGALPAAGGPSLTGDRAGPTEGGFRSPEEFRAFREYERRFRAEVAVGQRLQLWLDRIARRPVLLEAGLASLALCPPLARWLISQVGDCQTQEGVCRFDQVHADV